VSINEPVSINEAMIEAADYRLATARMLAFRSKMFTAGMKVSVDSRTYNGLGIVARIGSDVPPDKVPVTLENGNTWWYPIEDVTPEDKP
jgi:hypothetical protein